MRRFLDPIIRVLAVLYLGLNICVCRHLSGMLLYQDSSSVPVSLFRPAAFVLTSDTFQQWSNTALYRILFKVKKQRYYMASSEPSANLGLM